MRKIAPLRRKKAPILKQAWDNFSRAGLLSWKYATVVGKRRGAMQTNSLTLYGAALDAFNAAAMAKRRDASISATILKSQRRFRPLLERDRIAFLDNLVIRADGAVQILNTYENQ